MKHLIKRKKIYIVLFGIAFIIFYSKFSKPLEHSEPSNELVNANNNAVINILLWGTNYGPNKWFMQKAASRNITYDKKVRVLNDSLSV